MVAALIIAAGKNAHSNYFEPHRIVGSIPAIRRIVMVFQRAGIERVVVVCHKDGDQVEKLASYMNVTFLHSGGEADMLDNVKIGLDYLLDKCDEVIVTHTDVPLFSVETVQALIAAAGSARIPVYHGSGGHPILLHASLFQGILSYSGEGGLSGAMKASGVQPHLIDVEDEGVLINMRDQDGDMCLPSGHSLQGVHPAIRIRLYKEKAFYGPGAHQLLQLTDETGSVREACRCMGMSYNKGRGIISAMEQQLGYPVINSQQGGKTGGSSVVNEKGQELMRNYAAYSADAKRCLLELFEKHFGANA
ncbi:MAG: NTP transferase domain-containing protein [Peptococcaceae bacterium]|jgi:molybdate transport repressor ModE-like protein|nr:NTP transferase domain-containing protein [Peptococcaceae bacterium]